ncbi:GDYXXLXY domain-containing protein [Peribacillus glennii]|uniref:GDYXXLXY domain-containing protein n=1 Tax=Peribacillus glennii TaxID=2303991 RepID=A0A372L6Q2_9BACI|nr:GDYXXLXY domain-containing protein [Peribacillus glennii]RFU60756.1 hypothetical protein D0466_20605 [Peribacillus glennii]
MHRNRKWVWAALAIPFLCIAIVAAKPVTTLLYGEEIILSTAPVDPTDLFYGDYLILSYDISEAAPELVDQKVRTADYSEAVKKPLYLWLKKKNNIGSLTRVSFEKPPHSLYLKAGFHNLWLNEETKKYNIPLQWDRYYVPENQGREWEERATKGDILVHMKVRNGFAVPISIE